MILPPAAAAAGASTRDCLLPTARGTCPAAAAAATARAGQRLALQRPPTAPASSPFAPASITPWAMEATASPRLPQMSGSNMLPQQQQHRARTYGASLQAADSFNRWAASIPNDQVAAEAEAEALAAASRPSSPNTSAVELAAAMPGSPISSPLARYPSGTSAFDSFRKALGAPGATSPTAPAAAGPTRAAAARRAVAVGQLEGRPGPAGQLP